MKISEAEDISSLQTTDMIPVERTGDMSAYYATMDEVTSIVLTEADSAYEPKDPAIQEHISTVHPVEIGGTGSTISTGIGAVVLKNTPTLLNPTLQNFTESFVDPPAGSLFTPQLSLGTVQRLTTNGNATITLPPSEAGKSYTLYVKYGGVHSITFAGGSTLRWPGGVVPTPTSVTGKTDIYVFSCDGTSTFGADGGRNY